MVERSNRDRGTVEQWNSGTSDGGTVEHLIVEQSNNHDGTVEPR